VFSQLAVWLSCVDKKKGHELIMRRRGNSPHQDQMASEARPHYLIKSSMAFFVLSGMSVALITFARVTKELVSHFEKDVRKSEKRES